jgi:hypothetical protein
MKIVIEKYIPASNIDKYGLGTWYWYIETGYTRTRGGIAYTRKGAEHRARRQAAKIQRTRDNFQHIEIEV